MSDKTSVCRDDRQAKAYRTFDGLRLPQPNAYNVRPDCLKIIVFNFGSEPQMARFKQLIVRSLS